MAIVTVEMDDQDAKHFLSVIQELSQLTEQRGETLPESWHRLAERLEASLDEVDEECYSSPQ